MTGLVSGNDELSWVARPFLRLSYRLLLLVARSDMAFADKETLASDCQKLVFTEEAEARLLAETAKAFVEMLQSSEWKEDAANAGATFLIGLGKSILTWKVDTMVFDGLRQGIKAGHMAWKNHKGCDVLEQLQRIYLQIPQQIQLEMDGDLCIRILRRISQESGAQRDSWQIQIACVYQIHRISRIILAKESKQPKDLEVLEEAIAGTGLLRYCRLERRLSSQLKGSAQQIMHSLLTSINISFATWTFP